MRKHGGLFLLTLLILLVKFIRNNFIAPAHDNMTPQQPKPLLKKFLDLDLLRIIGFIADITAIVSVVLAIKLPNVGNPLSALLTPWSCIVLWCFAVYTFICILHNYWERTQYKNIWSSGFGLFIVGDLVFKFRKPVLLFPFLILIALLIYIASLFGSEAAIVTTGILVFIIIMVLATISDNLENHYIDPRETLTEQSKLDQYRTIVDSNWDEFKTMIEGKLSNKQWLSVSDFNEVMLLKGIESKALLFAFLRYAAEHPDKTHFGSIYKKPNPPRKRKSLITKDALVNIHKIDSEEYLLS